LEDKLFDFNSDESQKLFQDYSALVKLAESVTNFFMVQIHSLVERNNIVLACPVEMRIKEWGSFRQKFEGSENYKSASDIKDLIGVRLTTLFEIDCENLSSLIQESFPITKHENISLRLNEDQFGYRSNHFNCEINEFWLREAGPIDSLTAPCEIQIRTLPQHMWAAASHKHRRAISRISALLELVDQEFTRLLVDQKEHLTELRMAMEKRDGEESTPLDVANLQELLQDIFPSQNKKSDEGYFTLLKEATVFGLKNIRDLREAINFGYEHAMDYECHCVKRNHEALDRIDQQNPAFRSFLNNTFLGHCQLAREAIMFWSRDKKWT